MTIAQNKRTSQGHCLNKTTASAAIEHQLVGHMNPKCARCLRSLMEIVREPNVPCIARPLPFELPMRAGDKKRAIR